MAAPIFDVMLGRLVSHTHPSSGGSAVTVFNLNAIESRETVSYVGKSTDAAEWWVAKIDRSSSPIAITNATVVNNATVSSYALAWSNRADLTYGSRASAFN